MQKKDQDIQTQYTRGKCMKIKYVQKKLWVLVFLLIASFAVTYIQAPCIVYADEDEEETENEEPAPAISDTKLTIPINGEKKVSLSVLNPLDDDVYIFKSNHPKIVSVKKKTGLLKKKKTGQAEVSVYKKKKKKNKLIGTCAITVSKAKVLKKNQTLKVLIDHDIMPVITYQNSKATYQFKSSAPDIVKVDKVIDEETGADKIAITALAKGRATLTVKEKYKKKKTVVGTVDITVKVPTLVTESISMLKGQKLKISSVVKVKNEDPDEDIEYEYESADEEVLYVDENEMIAEETTAGVILSVYRVAEETRLLGTVTVKITEAIEKIPQIASDSNYVDLSDYENDYTEDFDEYSDNDYYQVGDDYVEDESADADDSYADYDQYVGDASHSW